MKTKKRFLGFMIIAAFATFFIQSCSKDDKDGNISETDIALAQDDAYADALFEEVDNMVVEEITALDVNAYSTVGLKSTEEDDLCFTVTVDHPDSTHFPKVVTLDFGEGCTVIIRDDTITRKGQIIITVTDRWFVPGAEHIVTFKDFYLNDVKIEGTKTITNMGLNSENHLELGIDLVGGKITFNDTAWITRDASHVREWISHFPPQNDTLLITGSANGINVLGQTYNRTITEPLVLVHCRDSQWRWVIVDGTVELVNSATGTTIIDYSADECDGTVIINKNGYRHNYIFKYNHRFHHRGGRH